MSKQFGYDETELDRPDLNKCPDCECYFSSLTCPLCHKICPEEMRAGNRLPPPKPKKKKRRSESGRVKFINWYHEWWFIVILFLIMPLAGLVVLFTSPHKFRHKIMFVCAYIAAPILLSATVTLCVLGFGAIFGQDPVDTSLSREQYVEECVEVAPEDYYRSPDAYEDAYVCMTLEVEEKRVTDDGLFYICHPVGNDGYMIIIRDYLQDGKQNFINGDVLIIYGQPSSRNFTVEVNGQAFDAPCINAAYAEIKE